MIDTVKDPQRPGKRALPRLGVTMKELRPETQVLLIEIRSLRAGIRRRLWVMATA